MTDEHSGTMPEMSAVSAEWLARLGEETRRNALRMKHLGEMILDQS